MKIMVSVVTGNMATIDKRTKKMKEIYSPAMCLNKKRCRSLGNNLLELLI